MLRGFIATFHSTLLRLPSKLVLSEVYVDWKNPNNKKALNFKKTPASEEMLTSASLLCYNMFFDHNIIQRGPTVVDTTNQDLVSENNNEDLYNPTIPTEDMWKRFALPTPPYSPETYPNNSKNHVFTHHPQNNLQVVPDDFPEDLSSDLPMVLSDAEMERLTSSTLANDCVWSEQELDPNTIPQIRAPVCQLDSIRESQTLYSQPEKHFREYRSFPQGLPVQERCMNQQQPPQNWAPYAVESNPSQAITCARQASQQEEFAPPRFELNMSGKRTRKPRRGSRNSPQRQESVENEDSEDSEISRATHNVLERQRREDLKCRFQLLRDCIPELEENERAPKVAILKKSREFVHQLILEEQRLCADKELERQRRLILLERLHMLRNGYTVM